MNDANQLPPELPPRSDGLGLGFEHSQTPPAEAPELELRRRRTARILSLAVVAAVTLLVTIGYLGHARRSAAAFAVLTQQRDAVPKVRTLAVTAVETPRIVDLPASMQAFNSATLFARATGYISERKVDIGSRVHAGDLLALIAAPELDQQLAQARAQLAQADAALTQSRASLQQAQANQDLAAVTNQRYSRLAPQGYASQQ